MIIEQRSAEWFQMRKGRITSSEIYKIMGKGDFSETAKTYLLEKVCELYGGVTEPATGAALSWGTDLEPVAIEHYLERKATRLAHCSEIKTLFDYQDLSGIWGISLNSLVIFSSLVW